MKETVTVVCVGERIRYRAIDKTIRIGDVYSITRGFAKLPFADDGDASLHVRHPVTREKDSTTLFHVEGIIPDGR